MRWPFGRNARPDANLVTPSAASGDGPPIERPEGAWRSLPAVQRATGEPPTIAPAAPFAAGLATRRPAGLALAPLGHEVSALGSAGVIVGIAAPSGAALSGRAEPALKRTAATLAPDAAQPAGWSSFDAADRSAGPAPTTGGQLPQLAQRIAADGAGLTSTSPALVPAAPAGTFELRPASAGASGAAPASAGERAGPPAEVGPFASIDAAPAATVAATADPAARRPTLGQARRLGLGVPLAGSAAPSVQRSALPGGTPSGDTGGAGVRSRDRMPGSPQQASAPIGPAGLGTGALGASQPATAAPFARPGLTVVRPTSIQRLAPALPGGPFDADPQSRPIGPGLSLVRADPGQPSADDETGGDEAGRREAPGTGFGRPGELVEPARAGSAAPDAANAPLGGLPIRVSSASRLIGPGAGSPAVGTPAAQGGRTLSAPGPVVARSSVDPGGALALEARSGHPPALPAATRSWTAGSGGQPARPAVMPMAASARPATPGPDPVSAADAAASTRSVQRAVEINELPVGPTVADQPPGGPASAPGVAEAPAASTVDKDRELDDLARRLYGRIRARLSAELLADRERAGAITDLR